MMQVFEYLGEQYVNGPSEPEPPAPAETPAAPTQARTEAAAVSVPPSITSDTPPDAKAPAAAPATSPAGAGLRRRCRHARRSSHAHKQCARACRGLRLRDAGAMRARACVGRELCCRGRVRSLFAFVSACPLYFPSLPWGFALVSGVSLAGPADACSLDAPSSGRLPYVCMTPQATEGQSWAGQLTSAAPLFPRYIFSLRLPPPSSALLHGLSSFQCFLRISIHRILGIG